MTSNVVSLPARPGPRELRRERRIVTSGRAVLQVVQTDDPHLLGATFHADVMEASTGGMRLTSNRFVENCRVDIWINLDGHQDKLFLTAEVRWSSHEAGNEYQLGLELVSNSLTDNERWCEICHLL